MEQKIGFSQPPSGTHTRFSLILGVAVFAAPVWADGDRQAANCWGEWVDVGTRDGAGLRLNVCLVSLFSQKVIKINCQCVCVPWHLQFLKRLIYHWRL